MLVAIALVPVPISLILRFAGGPPAALFAVAGIAIIPLAYLMGVATEELGKDMGAGIGGLLNATFGNATEIIIALFALNAGLITVVKASLTGSIVGNILLVLGLSLLLGGARHKRQTFERRAAATRSTMLTLAVAGLLMPTAALLAFSVGGLDPAEEARLQGILGDLSVWIALVLLATYFLGLLFSLHTHRHLFNPAGEHAPRIWSRRMAFGVLVGATALVSLESELLVSSLESAKDALGVNDLFMGVIIIAVVGNAAEHGSAILTAWRNEMDLAVGIATASSTQIALFAAPILVFAGVLMGQAMDLAFETFEILSMALAVAVVAMVAGDGESNWFEGVLLLMLYAVIAIGFYFHP